MTPEQYKHEITQNAIFAFGKTTNEEERSAIGSFVAKCFTSFWTDERKQDYLNYIDAPNGTICPMCKD